MWFDWVSVAMGLLVFLMALGWWQNGYFKRRGIKSPPAYVPFLGNTWGMITKKEHFKDTVQKNYHRYPGEKYIGTIQFNRVTIMINDLNLLKQVCIKDFDYFMDHHSSNEDIEDMLFGKSLFGLKGQKWKDMRATLSPAFTSSKIKGMFPFMFECGEQLGVYLIKEMEKEENRVRGLLELEFKDLFTRYANDVIATTAFGLRVNSLEDKENIFFMTGKDATNFSGTRFLKFLLIIVCPKISKFLGITVIPEKACDFFRNLVWDTIKDREERNVVRNDLIQLLMEARKGDLKHTPVEDEKEAGFATAEESLVGKTHVKREWEDDDIVAQALGFFGAGFDTTSGLICFLMHELALHPEIQNKLQMEIDEVAAVLNGKITYDCLQKMKYMDMVVCETMRFWPPGIATDRQCIKPYTLPPPNEKSTRGYQMNVGEGITIPIYALHHDPKFFEKPEIFDPERFSDENKTKIVPGSFIPFGLGPRNCIGSRFALIEVKAVVYNILLKFDVVPTAKTQHPIQLKKDSLNLNSENGFWLGLKLRKKTT